MTFFFHPEADVEFFESVDYYEECELGLGCDFSVEVYPAINTILEYPEAWSVIENAIRRFLINRFPFGILCSIEQKMQSIFA